MAERSLETKFSMEEKLIKNLKILLKYLIQKWHKKSSLSFVKCLFRFLCKTATFRNHPCQSVSSFYLLQSKIKNKFPKTTSTLLPSISFKWWNQISRGQIEMIVLCAKLDSLIYNALKSIVIQRHILLLLDRNNIVTEGKN